MMLAALGTSVFADQTEEAARVAATELTQKLGVALKKEITASGPDGAVSVCRDIAPALAGEQSRKTGSRVTRVSLRTRNPLLGQPDAWEQQVLADFDRRATRGEKTDSLEHSEIVIEPQGRYFRYMKAIPVQPLCLTCHGSAETIPDSVKAKLTAEYPHDRATGYSLGQIRGAVSIKQFIGEDR